MHLYSFASVTLQPVVRIKCLLTVKGAGTLARSTNSDVASRSKNQSYLQSTWSNCSLDWIEETRVRLHPEHSAPSTRNNAAEKLKRTTIINKSK